MLCSLDPTSSPDWSWYLYFQIKPLLNQQFAIENGHFDIVDVADDLSSCGQNLDEAYNVPSPSFSQLPNIFFWTSWILCVSSQNENTLQKHILNHIIWMFLWKISRSSAMTQWIVTHDGSVCMPYIYICIYIYMVCHLSAKTPVMLASIYQLYIHGSVMASENPSIPGEDFPTTGPSTRPTPPTPPPGRPPGKGDLQHEHRCQEDGGAEARSSCLGDGPIDDGRCVEPMNGMLIDDK